MDRFGITSHRDRLENAAPMTAKVTAGRRNRFALDNGQVWEALENIPSKSRASKSPSKRANGNFALKARREKRGRSREAVEVTPKNRSVSRNRNSYLNRNLSLDRCSKERNQKHDKITITIKSTIPPPAMLRLANRELTVEPSTPPRPMTSRPGLRYCWGGLHLPVTDAKLGPLVSGPAYSQSHAARLRRPGLPESFRHTRRETTPAHVEGDTGLRSAPDDRRQPRKGAQGPSPPASSSRASGPSHPPPITSSSKPASAAGFSYELSRKSNCTIARSVRSRSSPTSATRPSRSSGFRTRSVAHGKPARLKLPAGTTIPENPGFAVAADGTLNFKAPVRRTPRDNQFRHPRAPT